MGLFSKHIRAMLGLFDGSRTWPLCKRVAHIDPSCDTGCNVRGKIDMPRLAPSLRGVLGTPPEKWARTPEAPRFHKQVMGCCMHRAGACIAHPLEHLGKQIPRQANPSSVACRVCVQQAACSVSAQEVKVERFWARWAWLKIQELGLRRF